MFNPSFNALSPLLANKGTNYALSKPILDLRDGQKKQNSKLHDAIRKLYLAKLNEEKATWDSWLSWGQLIALYCRGEFYLRKSRGVGYYVQPLPNSENRQRSANLIRTYRHMCVSKVTSTNPTVRIGPADDDPRSIAAAQNARPMIDYWEGQFYKPRFNQRAALYKLNNGITITRVRWNPFAEGPQGSRYEIDEDEGEMSLGQGSGECLDCDHEGEAEDFTNPQLEYGGQCPNCGSSSVDVTPPAKSNLLRIRQAAPQNMGAPEISLVPLPAMRWDLAVDLEESDWAVARHRITLGDVKLLVGDAILPDTQSSENKDLEMLHNLAYAGNTFSGTGTNNNNRKFDRTPTACEFWIKPNQYADIMIEGGMTVDGIELPPGRMSDIFTKPVCVVGLNDMSLQVGIFGELHKDQFVTGQWEVEADSGAGRGIQDAALTQRRYNRWDGHIDQGLAAHATPTVLIDKRFLDDDQSGYLFKPGETIKLNLSMLPAGSNLSNAMYVPDAKGMNPQAIAYGQNHLMDMFQLQTFNMEFNSNLMGVDPQTFGGAQLASSLANSLFGPVGGIIGGERVRVSEILVDLTRKHDPVGRFYPGKDGTRGKVVSGKDLQGKLVHELVQDSITPSTPFTQRQDLNAWLTGLGGVDGMLALKQGDPELYRETARISNVKLGAEDDDLVSTICLGRLDQMKEQLEAGVTDPDMLIESISPPPDAIEPKHAEKRNWLSLWMDLEEGLKAPIPLRQAVSKLYWLHMTLESQKNNLEAAAKGMTQGIGVAAAQAPSALGAQALQNMQGGGQDPAQQQQAEQQAQAQQQQNDHEHEAAGQVMQMQQERDIKGAELDAENTRTHADLVKTVLEQKHAKETQEREIESKRALAKLAAQKAKQTKPAGGAK